MTRVFTGYGYTPTSLAFVRMCCYPRNYSFIIKVCWENARTALDYTMHARYNTMIFLVLYHHNFHGIILQSFEIIPCFFSSCMVTIFIANESKRDEHI